jgi:two-component system, OmpR family, sensor kinase
VNARSIRFRLVAWYAGMFLLICTAFGAYTYVSLRHYLASALQDTLRRRAHQIGTSRLLSAERTGESFVIDQIKTLYGPELNDRFIRISRPDGSLLYVSGTPHDMSFEPTRIPKVEVQRGEPKVTPIAGEHMLLLSAPFAVRDRSYLVEVGASTLEGEKVLRGFILTLGLGLPLVLAFAVGGGFLMVEGALRPVHRVTDAAREITLHNLSRRLPVVESGDEIEHLSVALNQMIARLDEAFQHAGRFTADASHELRTPLTVMRGELESVVQDPSLGGHTRARLGSVLEETERLARIVEDLLAISRLEAGEARLERSRFDLSNLVVTTADQMSLLAEDKGIEVVCRGEECVEVEGDSARLKQVVVNLLDNAVKYTPAAGRVSLETRRAKDQAVLEVVDSGPGIPESALPRVFDRFFRVDGTRAGEGGAGLGLSIVRLICAAHGGSVALSNPSTGGCRVTVTLPLARAGAGDGAGGARW